MESLRRFNDDKRTKEELLDYLIQYLREKAADKAFNRESVSDIADAKETILGAFAQLDIDFSSKVKKDGNTENKAR